MGIPAHCLSLRLTTNKPLEGSEGQLEGSEGQPAGSEGQPAGSEGQPEGGQMDGRTDGRTYVRTEFLPILQDFVPCRAAAQKHMKF